MPFRKLLFWAHLAAGVTAGIVILVMSATGVVLMYERQLIEWSDRHYRSVAPQAGVPRLSVEALPMKAAEQRPEQAPAGITLRSENDAPASVTLGNATVYQDVYTGLALAFRRFAAWLRSGRAAARYQARESEAAQSSFNAGSHSRSAHRRAVTRGARIAFFFWIQSMIRDDGERTLPFDLGMAIQRLNQDMPDPVGALCHRRGPQPPYGSGPRCRRAANIARRSRVSIL